MVEIARARAHASSGSRAATRSSSAAAARRPRRWSRPGSPFEVVPGVTAGIAAPAYAGIPVTHRDDASAVAFVTGHEDPEKEESAIDWEALARFPGTLVLYMGVKRLPTIAERLIAAGPRPRRARGGGRARHPCPTSAPSSRPLATLPGGGRRGRARGRRRSSLFGPVAARREPIAWLERRPLHGRRVVVTRARAQASGLARDAARPRRRGGRAAGDPDRAADRHAPRSRRCVDDAALLRARLPDQPERRPSCCSRRWPSAASTPARSPTRRSPRSAPGTARGAARARRDRRHRPAALVAEALVEALRGGRGRAGGRCWSPAPPRPATCSPTRCASAAPRSTSSPLYETVREDAERGARSRRRATPTTSPSPPPRPCATSLEARRRPLPGRRPGRLDRPGDQRRPPASSGSRSTSRPSATTPTGLVEALLADADAGATCAAVGRVHVRRSSHVPDGAADHVPLRLRGRRRVRRRLPRRDRADRARRPGDRHHPRDRPPRRPRRRAAVLADALPFAPAGVHLAIVDPGVGGPRRAVAVRCAERGTRSSSAPTTACCRPRSTCFGGAAEAVDISASPFRLEPPSATFHGRDLFAPVAAHLAARRDLAEAGVPIDPASLERQPSRAPAARAAPRLRPRRPDRRLRQRRARPDRARTSRPPARRRRRGSRSARRSRRLTRRARDRLRRGRRGLVPLLRGLLRPDGGRVNRGDASELLELRPGDEVELEPAP